MENKLKYELENQFFAEEIVDEIEGDGEVETPESNIDLDKLDEINKPDEEISELEKLKKEVEEANQRAEKAEQLRKRDKAARDKAMKERAALSREVQEKEKALDEPNEELAELRAVLAEKELAEKKNSLRLAATDRMAIKLDMANTLVDALYHPDTGEVDEDSVVDAFTTILREVREAEFNKGYDTRDTEMASQKPRSRGGVNPDLTPEQEALERYKERTNRK